MAKRKRARNDGPTPERSPRSRQALTGFVIGFLAWHGAMQFLVGVIPYIGLDINYPIVGLFGAFIAVSRFRAALWGLAGLVVLCFFVFGFTPVVERMTHGWVRSDALQKAPAVVVLAAGTAHDGEIPEKGQARILHGYEVVRQGYAPILIVSRGLPNSPSWVPAVNAQMERLGIVAPVVETKPVESTRDEAVAVAEIARARGWEQIILVTDPLHMRRSAAVFEKAGMRVIASPCKDWRFNLNNLVNMPMRHSALREWLHEVVGCWSYRRRGWMD